MIYPSVSSNIGEFSTFFWWSHDSTFRNMAVKTSSLWKINFNHSSGSMYKEHMSNNSRSLFVELSLWYAKKEIGNSCPMSRSDVSRNHFRYYPGTNISNMAGPVYIGILFICPRLHWFSWNSPLFTVNKRKSILGCSFPQVQRVILSWKFKGSFEPRLRSDCFRNIVWGCHGYASK